MDTTDIALVDQVAALCAADIDAIAFLAAHPSGTIYQAAGSAPRPWVR